MALDDRYTADVTTIAPEPGGTTASGSEAQLAAPAHESRVARHRAERSHRTALGVALTAAVAVCAVVALGFAIGWQLPEDVLGAMASSVEAPESASPSDVAGAGSVPVSSEPTVAAPAVAPTPSITIKAVGDIAFVSSVDRLMKSSGDEAPVAAIADYIADADLTIGNLETALSTRGAAVAGKTFTFRSNPAGAIASLRRGGFDVVSLANNHTRDWGGDALSDTLTSLSDAGIAYAGAGESSAQAFAPAVVDVRGATVAYLAFSQIGPSNFVATDAGSGTAYTLDLERVMSLIAAADGAADYVVVSFHWGVEKSYTPNERQVSFGRAAIDAGADAVLAHHPHVLQGVEFYNNGMIAYSLGNFVFSPGSNEGRDTMVLSLTLTPDGVHEATARTAFIHTTGATKLAEGATAERIGGQIQGASSQLGTVATIEQGGQVVRLNAN